MFCFKLVHLGLSYQILICHTVFFQLFLNHWSTISTRWTLISSYLGLFTFFGPTLLNVLKVIIWAKYSLECPRYLLEPCYPSINLNEGRTKDNVLVTKQNIAILYSFTSFISILPKDASFTIILPRRYQFYDSTTKTMPVLRLYYLDNTNVYQYTTW